MKVVINNSKKTATIYQYGQITHEPAVSGIQAVESAKANGFRIKKRIDFRRNRVTYTIQEN